MKNMGWGGVILLIICMGICPPLAILVFIGCGIFESAKDSYNASNHPYQTPDCFKKKPWEK